MLNLSDKELDRLSRDAASRHDPGDFTGPGAWDRLELRLDKELGKAAPGPNPFRGIRRLPFQYVPVILLIAGVAVYFVKQYRPRKAEPSGSPPMSVVKSINTLTRPGQMITDSSLKVLDHKENSTPASEPHGAKVTGDQNGDQNIVTGNGNIKTGSDKTGPGSRITTTVSSNTTGSTNTMGTDDKTGSGSATAGAYNGIAGGHAGSGRGRSGYPGPYGRTGHPTADAASLKETPLSDRSTAPADGMTTAGMAGSGTAGTAGAGSLSSSRGQKDAGNVKNNTSRPPHDLTLSSVKGPCSLTTRPTISDSALRSFTKAPAPLGPGKSPGRSLHINRSLQFGFQVAPDFTSVNSLAGDKPGSSIGFTVDYQFVDRLYLQTGVLFSKKNYTARLQDCHMPYDYFRMNDLHQVDFVKGTLNMLEIPLNLRYDFSVTGSTIFFASGGLSSYVLLGQRSDYYYNFFGREAYKTFHYSDKQTYLFSAVNLSLGVETGLSNNLSLVIAPYVKLPASSVGFGDFKMNSVGINFALKFAPVISRKRK